MSTLNYVYTRLILSMYLSTLIDLNILHSQYEVFYLKNNYTIFNDIPN